MAEYVPARKLHAKQNDIFATVDTVLAELKADAKLSSGATKLEEQKEAVAMMISSALAVRNPRTKEGFEDRAVELTADWMYLAAAYAVLAGAPEKAIEALGLAVEAYIRANA